MANSSRANDSRKAFLSPEQVRVVAVMRQYERSYISQSSTQGHFLVLNGDPTERVFESTLRALIKKGWLEKNGLNRFKLTE